MSQQTLTSLRQLKLGGMASALQLQLEQPGTYQPLGFTERLDLLISQEQLCRDHRKQDRLVRQARFKLKASIQDIDYDHPRNITRSQIVQLSSPDWVIRGQNLLITGPCGSGKTYLGCAIAHALCLQGFTARYYRISRLLLMLHQARADGTYNGEIQRLAKTQVLIIDDWGLEPLKGHQRNDLLEVFDDRHPTLSTIMISQLPTDQWYASIGENTLADAILDRIMHNAHRLQLKGESMRRKMAKIDGS